MFGGGTVFFCHRDVDINEFKSVESENCPTYRIITYQLYLAFFVYLSLLGHTSL